MTEPERLLPQGPRSSTRATRLQARLRRSNSRRFAVVVLFAGALGATGLGPFLVPVAVVIVAAAIWRRTWTVPLWLGLVGIAVIPFFVRGGASPAVQDRLAMLVIVLLAIAVVRMALNERRASAADGRVSSAPR
jgi:formate-dependent nitrite reductase membrane component NrfD